MSAIAYTFKCADCGMLFEAPEVPEFSYGLFVLRSEGSDETVFLDSFEDIQFDEVSKSIEGLKAVRSLSVPDRAKLQHVVFSLTCDVTPEGHLVRIGLLPRCPSCGSRRMESWQPTAPIRDWALPAVTHKSWVAKSSVEKALAIGETVRRFIQN